MALTKGTNSYSTLLEADAYLQDRIGDAEWISIGAQAQEQALVTATRILEEMNWVGSASSNTQNLAFPRRGSYVDPSRGRTITFNPDATEAPRRVKEAQYELAFHLTNNPDLINDTGRAVNLSVGNGAVVLADQIPASLIPGAVRRKIAPLLVNGGSRRVF